MLAPHEASVLEDIPTELRQAGAVVEKTIEYLLEQSVGEFAIATALLGGSIDLLARSMGDAAILRMLESAARSVRAGELRRDGPGAG
jgi:hypothetical protein